MPARKWGNNFNNNKKIVFESDWKWTQRVGPYRPVWYDNVYCLTMEKHVLEEKGYCTSSYNHNFAGSTTACNLHRLLYSSLSLPISCLILHITLSNEVVKMPKTYLSRKKICFNKHPFRYFRYWVNSPARIYSPHIEQFNNWETHNTVLSLCCINKKTALPVTATTNIWLLISNHPWWSWQKNKERQAQTACANVSVSVRGVMTLAEQCSWNVSYVLHFLPPCVHTQTWWHMQTHPHTLTRMHGHTVRPRLSAAAHGPHCHIHLPLFRHHAGGVKWTTPFSSRLPTQPTQTPTKILSTHIQTMAVDKLNYLTWTV